jgi:hypothetical protein
MSYYPPQQPQSPYQQSYNPAPQNSTMAIISLISGIVSWFLLPLIGAIVAIITGHMAKNEIKASNGQIGGNGMATAGLILGYVQLGITCCLLIGSGILMAIGVLPVFFMDY